MNIDQEQVKDADQQAEIEDATSSSATMEWLRKTPVSVKRGLAGLAFVSVFGAGYLIAGNSQNEKQETEALSDDFNDQNMAGVSDEAITDADDEIGPSTRANENIEDANYSLLSESHGNLILEPNEPRVLHDPTIYNRNITANSHAAGEAIKEAIDNNQRILFFRGIVLITLRQDVEEGETYMPAFLRLENPAIIPIDDEVYWAAYNTHSQQFLTHKIGRYDDEESWVYYNEGLRVESSTFTVEGKPHSGQMAELEPEHLDSVGVSGLDRFSMIVREEEERIVSRALIISEPYLANTHTGRQLFMNARIDNPDNTWAFSDWIEMHGEITEKNFPVTD